MSSAEWQEWNQEAYRRHWWYWLVVVPIIVAAVIVVGAVGSIWLWIVLGTISVAWGVYDYKRYEHWKRTRRPLTGA